MSSKQIQSAVNQSATQIMAPAADALKKLLPNFILISQTSVSTEEITTTFHVENLKEKSVFDMLFITQAKVFEVYLANHPEFASDYRKIFLDLDADYKAALKRANTRIDSYVKKEKK